MIQNIILILQKYGLIFAQGLWNTVWLSLVSVLLGTILGVLIALGKMSGVKVLCKVTGIYIEIIRGTPMLLQLYFFWLALPSMIPDIPDIVCILIALVINASAYIAEIIRAGIQAVDAGQTEAALSLGMDRRNVMTKIIFPQAVKNILPAIGNEMIALLKETSVAGYVAVVDLTRAGNLVRNNTYDAFNPLMAVALTYLLLVVLMSRALKKLERRLAKSDKR